MDYPGPYCKDVGLTCSAIINKQVEKSLTLTNGIVLEIYNLTKKHGYTLKHFVQVLSLLNKECQNIAPSTLTSNVTSVIVSKNKLVTRRFPA
ncbi:hypothetical protein DPMN_135199 [Dreissena polymorpha]|uniref:Uncharacterized protein n=1 Tax=Dreissena polymorpha TaxID=45954 RepID=A0A9D4JBE8_DREPO|nr:hypothetical protein DPMN_135199 [Dreissena polymorpha]